MNRSKQVFKGLAISSRQSEVNGYQVICSLAKLKNWYRHWAAPALCCGTHWYTRALVYFAPSIPVSVFPGKSSTFIRRQTERASQGSGSYHNEFLHLVDIGLVLILLLRFTARFSIRFHSSYDSL